MFGIHRWWKLREVVASDLLTKNIRMLLVQRRFVTAKTGTILLQSLYRGFATRRELATTKIQTQVRRRKHYVAYIKLKSVTISLQCRQRRGTAKKVLAALKYEQKDIGKLKQNNEKLKNEMASLRAMLSAQAKQGAMKMESDKELEEREAEIKKHTKRIKELEDLLENEKENVIKLEKRVDDKDIEISKHQETISILKQKNQNMSMAQVSSPRSSRKSKSSLAPSSPKPYFTNEPTSSVSPRNLSKETYSEYSKALEEARAQVTMLERELERERAARRETDSEVIKLRAQASGVNLGEEELKALLPSDEDIKSSISLPVLDSSSMDIEQNDTSDTIESDER